MIHYNFINSIIFSISVTGASFIVFNGALKTTSGLSAKSSIVEDGLMVQVLSLWFFLCYWISFFENTVSSFVTLHFISEQFSLQIPADMMTKLREALRNMKNFDIPCGPISTSMPDEVVSIEWTSDDKNFNVGLVFK